MSDPTREEMTQYLNVRFADEFDDFDREEAIYWFAHNYHGGQWSNLYSTLSTSPYTPSPIASDIDPGGASFLLYEALVDEFGGASGS